MNKWNSPMSYCPRIGQPAGDGSDARLYLGIAAQGRGPKVVFLRSTITLMAAAQAAWNSAAAGTNPADPYMTVVAYFNALRELGSARRIVEDETVACPEVKYLVEFIRTSKRGVNLRRPPKRMEPVGVDE